MIFGLKSKLMKQIFLENFKLLPGFLILILKNLILHDIKEFSMNPQILRFLHSISNIMKF